jgi:ATP-dependent RNA helicase RhlE
MGFYDDVMVIANRLPKIRQNLLFSATMPPKIRTLANNLLTEPESISLAISKPAAGITQSAYMVDDHQKVKLVREILRERGNNLSHVLIFASSIKSVKKIKETLNTANMRASDMHSGLDQQQREDTIREFKNKKIRILVATNILSRGIDIKEIGLVINYEVPHDAEDYVHRIGRTARADRTGEAITFINQKDVSNFLEIEKLIKKKVPRLTLPKSLGATLEYNTVSRNKNKKHYFKKSPNKPNVPR